MVPVRRVTVHMKPEASPSFTFPRSHGKNENLGTPGRGEKPACPLLPQPSPYEFQQGPSSKGPDKHLWKNEVTCPLRTGDAFTEHEGS